MKNGEACKAGEGCCCPCHKMKAVFVFLFGLVFLLGAFDVISQHLVSIAWPIIVMLAGLKMMCKGMCKCCKEG